MKCQHCSNKFEEIPIQGDMEEVNLCVNVAQNKPLLIISEAYENGIDITNEEYSIKINYCPMCGQKLTHK